MAAPTNPPIVPAPMLGQAEASRLFQNWLPQDIYFDCIAGAAAGNHTVPGIRTRDVLLAVVHFASNHFTSCLTAQYTISASDTINNTAGTTSAGGRLMVVWVHVP
jgi:hypothetical protein